MTIVKRQESDSIPNDLPTVAPVQNGVVPTCKFVNLELCGMTTNEGRRGSRGTLLLENPRGCYPVKYKELVKQVRQTLFFKISSFVEKKKEKENM